MEQKIRIALSESEFRDLVAGREVEVKTTGQNREGCAVKIILSDIGWNRMQAALDHARGY